MIKKGVDVNRRDHVGRSPLHFAIMCNATEITYDLVDAGARMTARLVDGRTSLHLAVQRDQAAVVRKLLESSAQNREIKGTETEEECDENLEKDDRDRPSSEDDWSSEDDGVLEFDDEEGTDDEDGINADKKAVEDEGNGEGKPSRGDEEAEQGDEIPEDTTDQPDVLDLNATDWDFGLTPLAYAVIFASLPIIEDLIAAGADIQASTRNNKLMAHPLALAILRRDEDEACKVAERLILSGATSSPADSQFRTIFYRIVASKKVKLASTILRCDPNANAVINFPCIDQSGITFPLVLAIHNRDYSMIATLLAYGARLQPLEEDITRAISTRPATETLHLFYHRRNSNILTQAYLPVETALNRHDDIVRLLVTLGADVNAGIQTSYGHSTREEEKRSVFDWVNMAIAAMETKIKGGHKAKEGLKPEEFSTSMNWKEYATRAVTIVNFVMCQSYRNMKRGQIPDVEHIERTKQYFEDIRELLVSIGAKTWAELNDADILKSRSGRMGLFKGNADGLDSRTFKDYAIP
ncbi:hypothetical protein AX14_008142 [Amanita brunnescens Koide BX004]|nr:hypothetical protein AX14_008142 [Amanita brunnescens Koide BX004]